MGSYVKVNNKRYDLVGEEVVCTGDILKLTITKINRTISEIEEDFSNNETIEVHGYILNTLGEEGNEHEVETDDFIGAVFEGFTRITNISFDNIYNMITITLVIPAEIETRLADMEEAINFLLMGGDI